MAANVLQNHNQNPFVNDRMTRQMILFTAHDYPYLGILLSLSPIALRTLLYLASKLTPEGYACATLDELANRLNTSRSYANKGILELADCYLTVKKKRSQYWLDLHLFRPAQIEL